MNTSLPTALLDLESHLRETTLLSSTRGLLEWDERTKMPLQGGPYRAEQIALLKARLDALELAPTADRPQVI